MPENTKSFDWNLLKRFLAYLKDHKAGLVLMYLMTLIQVGTTIAIPYLIQQMIDGPLIGKDVGKLITLGAILIVILAVMYISTRTQGWLITRIGYNVLYSLRRDLFKKLQSLDFPFFDRQKTGQIITRLTSDIQVLEQVMQGGLATIFVDITMMIGVAAMMIVLDSRLSLILLVTIPLLCLLVFYVRQKILIVAREIQGKLGAVNGFLNESISGIKVIRSFAREEVNYQSFVRKNEDFFRSAKKSYPLIAIFWQGLTVISLLSQGLVLLGGGLLLARDLITIGVIIAFLSYVNRFFQPMQRLSNLINELSRAMASCERIFEVMDEPVNIVNHPQALRDFSIKGEVVFKDISFQYKKDEPVLDCINLKVDAGSKIAIVGPTGSGKSTIVNLLCRFYDPVSGRIEIDGNELKDLYLPEYRAQTAIVMQDAVLFSGTVLENIRFGKPDASLNEVRRVAGEMGIDDMFVNLPDGYNTMLEERGGNLSLGQKQLIAFTRALLRNPSILVLDEASAYIDTATEQLVQKAMEKLSKNRTTFIIAHRLSTISGSDCILVLKDGKISEKGTHSELLESGGHYAELLRSQFRMNSVL